MGSKTGISRLNPFDSFPLLIETIKVSHAIAVPLTLHFSGQSIPDDALSSLQFFTQCKWYLTCYERLSKNNRLLDKIFYLTCVYRSVNVQNSLRMHKFRIFGKNITTTDPNSVQIYWLNSNFIPWNRKIFEFLENFIMKFHLIRHLILPLCWNFGSPARDARTVTNWSWQTSDSDILVTEKHVTS